MEKASYFEYSENTLKCNLCPHECTIEEDKRGKCGVRKRIGNELFAENYDVLSAINIDPIEKKPLYHFYPGNSVLSIGTIGCNLKCVFCQNWKIAHTSFSNFPVLKEFSVKKIVSATKGRDNNIGIAYTYNEPTVFYEFMLDIAKEVKAVGMKNMIVSNGFINEKPLKELIPYIDAFNIDLKAFNEKFYKEYSGAVLEPVKRNLKLIKESGKHLEITNLIISTLNDDKQEFNEMIIWIKNELGPETVLHLSRYFPHYKLIVESTPPETLSDLYDIAREHLDFVYLGNIMSEKGKNTYCNKCGKLVIVRNAYTTDLVNIDDSGNCGYCGQSIVCV